MISNSYSLNCSNSSKALGKYCVFGPYDAMDIDEEAIEWTGKSNSLKDVSDIEMYDGINSRSSIICAVSSENKDQEHQFIEETKKYPLLFISLLLLNHNGIDKKTLIEKINNINELEKTCRIYYSSGKNELILLHYCNSFHNGLNVVLNKHNMIPSLLKTSTIFTVQEDALDSKHKLHSRIPEDEKVSCRLRCFVKNREKAREHLQKLGNYVMSCNAKDIKWYNILGSADILTEIDRIPLRALLTLYKTKQLLTHMNEDYANSWYNIETEFISSNGGMNYGGEYYYKKTQGSLPEMQGPAGAGITDFVCSKTAERSRSDG